LGVKRTSHFALHMSAYDPKRTWALICCYHRLLAPLIWLNATRLVDMVKFSVRNFAALLAYLGIICCAALPLLLFPGLAFPRDLDGKYENSPLKRWFESLASRRGFCCSFADGQSVEDVDWETKDGKYRVRLDSQWIEVPPDALVTAPNKFGLAVVWPYKDYEGRTQVRCFIPGAGG
jgi:hypothetical protein